MFSNSSPVLYRALYSILDGEAIVKYSMCKILDARRNVYMSLFYVFACS